jgi:hypothetical protein
VGEVGKVFLSGALTKREIGLDWGYLDWRSHMSKSTTGHRDGTGDGKAMHYRTRGGLLCLSKGSNRQATNAVGDVNCKLCIARLAKITSPTPRGAYTRTV